MVEPWYNAFAGLHADPSDQLCHQLEEWLCQAFVLEDDVPWVLACPPLCTGGEGIVNETDHKTHE